MKCVLTSCGKEGLLGKELVLPFAVSVPLVMSTFSVTFLWASSVQLSPKWPLVARMAKLGCQQQLVGCRQMGQKIVRKWKTISQNMESEVVPGECTAKEGSACEGFIASSQ